MKILFHGTSTTQSLQNKLKQNKRPRPFGRGLYFYLFTVGEYQR
jgi:hypothetical protein